MGWVSFGVAGPQTFDCSFAGHYSCVCFNHDLGRRFLKERVGGVLTFSNPRAVKMFVLAKTGKFVS